MTIRKWLREQWAVVLLVGLMLLSLPGGLTAGRWLKPDAVLWWAALSGGVVGVLLAGIARRPVVAVLLGIITGALFVAQAQGLILPPFEPGLSELRSLGRWAVLEAAKMVGILFEPVVTSVLPTAPPQLPEWGAAIERLRLYGWSLQADWPPVLAPRQWHKSQILIGSILGLLIWVASSLPVWALIRRRSTWGALLPVVGLLALNSYYTATGWAYLIASLSAGLLLAGSAAQDRLERRWEEGTLPYGLRADRWLMAGAIVVAVTVAMLLTVQLTDPDFRRRVRDTLFPPEQSAESSRGTSSNTSDRNTGPPPGVWPREHLLKGGFDLSMQPVMSIRTPGASPAHVYWKATSYNTYTGHGWLVSHNPFQRANAEPLWPESVEPPPHFVLLRQAFRLEFSTKQIYAAGRPVRLNWPASGTWSDQLSVDLISVEAVTPQSAYEVLSWVPSATPDELRAAPEDYPNWVRDFYLSLPDELPERVATLAQEVTVDAPTAYDKALALQSYLRTYPYTLEMDAPPADQDVVDFFLFELKQGYCDYYASAMVVMARSIGLPTRLTIGYATGVYDPADQAYHVSMADAHSWPEIYFPDLGWIPFEPTAARSTIEHGMTGEWIEEAAAAQAQRGEMFGTEGASGRIDLARVLWWLALIPAGIVLGTGGIALASTIRLQRQKRGTANQIITFLYRQLLGSGQRLGLMVSATQTPREFLAALQSELSIRAEHAPRRMGSWATREENAGHAASDLVSMYANMCYSPRQPELATARAMIDAWPRLNRMLWMFWLAGKRSDE